jgi:metal-responsive CopG/Arc/MetJ family transcriptional regulator
MDVVSQKPRRIRVTICLDPRLVATLDRQAFQQDSSRSRMIERIISGYATPRLISQEETSYEF